MTLSRLLPSRRTRRFVVLLAIVVLCLALGLALTAAAFAAPNNTTSNPNVKTSAGLEAPKLDYSFVWWSFVLTFGLLAVYYFMVLRLSYSEFQKIVDAHFGPRKNRG